MLGTDLGTLLVHGAAILVAVTIHEYAHAYVATILGDPTPRAHGRLTLNPFAHLDLLGTLLLFVAGFGWAKPVPVDPRNFPDWRKGTLLVAASGPLANVTALLILGLPAKLDVWFPAGWVAELWETLLWVNAVLAVFNLLPIPPLDGSRVLGAVLRGEQAVAYARLQPYGALLLLFLLVLGLLEPILRTPVTWLLRWATT